jgi:DNA-binding NarL/FixJ family response regulator
MTIISSAKKKLGYWRGRLFKNTFTHDGKRFRTNSWAVKIQHLGKRKTFTLHATNRSKAALEAFRIFEILVLQGWDVVTTQQARGNSKAAPMMPQSIPDPMAANDTDYWKPRLLRRKHPGLSPLGRADEFSVRIGHDGISHYFPLDTNDEDTAAAKALAIYRVIVRQGWDHANRRFSRELTLGFHWALDPLAWTYTTFHTWPLRTKAKPGTLFGKPSSSIAVVEGEAGIGQAIAYYLRDHQKSLGIVNYSSGEEALRKMRRRPFSLALVNHGLSDMQGDQFMKKLQALLPQLPTLIYSVYEDSDELFKATPGGAAGYLLKRTPPEQMLEPIAGLLSRRPPKPEMIIQQIKQYFQNVTLLLQSSGEVHEMGKLTPREKEILGHLSKGYLDKEIAHALGISVWTVHGHLKNIFEKLKVHSRTEAVVKFLQK